MIKELKSRIKSNEYAKKEQNALSVRMMEL